MTEFETTSLILRALWIQGGAIGGALLAASAALAGLIAGAGQ